MTDTTDRKPLLSDEMIASLILRTKSDDHEWPLNMPHRIAQMQFAGEMVRDFYETKITSGELMVVKTAMNTMRKESAWAEWICSECTGHFQSELGWEFCPGCGAKIIQ